MTQLGRKPGRSPSLTRDDVAVREFEWPRADLGWRDLLTGFADALWRFLRDNPGMAEDVRAMPGLPATIAELARAYVSRLTALDCRPGTPLWWWTSSPTSPSARRSRCAA